jgi:superfamily I DNA and RNA helicase
MLEIVYGATRHRALALQLAGVLESVISDGTIYLGYPVLASADDRVSVDALLVSSQCGIVAFQIAEVHPATQEDWVRLIRDQDQLYSVLESHLRRHDALRSGRRLVVDPRTITVFGAPVDPPPTAADGNYCHVEMVAGLVARFPSISADVLRALQGALQHVSTIKPAKRRTAVSRADSRGAVLRDIEKGIANLDRWQRQAAIESPDGPQRIRGLAGSGKTIVLALKASYLHAQHPDWTVAVTFFSRSLYQQFEDLITRFSFEQTYDKPDFEHLRILHAWGAPSRDGVYNSISQHLGQVPRDFGYGATTYGRSNAFGGVCGELLGDESPAADPLFDAVLIDEAQDLPPEFFQLVYRFTRSPKRIVWAFDELQKLDESAMPSTDELFGVTNGESNINTFNTPGEARRDIILPICYRNSPWALASAHAIGLGAYRTGGLIQHFDNPRLWEEIGYHIVSGALREGALVDLERSPASTPDYFEERLNPEDAVAVEAFATMAEQDNWLAERILENIRTDELEADDLLIVLPDARTAKSRASQLSRVLSDHGLVSHLVGVNSSTDQMFLRGSIAMAHIFRAKGNEAPMVYVLDAQYAVEPFNGVTRRNTLFTAMTRSRAWVRVYGWGANVGALKDEFEKIRQADYHLKFRVPNASELARMRRLNRDRSESEVASLDRVQQSMQTMFELIDSGEIDLEDFPAELRERLSHISEPRAVDAN